MPKTVLSSSSLRKMSTDDLEFILANDSDLTFKIMIGDLENFRNAIRKIKNKESLNRDDKNAMQNFKYGFAGWDVVWKPYYKENYSKCIKIISKEITSLRNKTNGSRLDWLIPTGIKTELRRRNVSY